MDKLDRENIELLKKLRKKWGIIGYLTMMSGLPMLFLISYYPMEYPLILFGMMVAVFTGMFFLMRSLKYNFLKKNYENLISLQIDNLTIFGTKILGKSGKLYIVSPSGDQYFLVLDFKEMSKSQKTKMKLKLRWLPWDVKNNKGIVYGSKELYCRIPTPEGKFIEGHATVHMIKVRKKNKNIRDYVMINNGQIIILDKKLQK